MNNFTASNARGFTRSFDTFKGAGTFQGAGAIKTCAVKTCAAPRRILVKCKRRGGKLKASPLTFRKAAIHDAGHIQKLINEYASKNLMLARSLSEIYETIRDFWVCEENKKIIACCALHVVGWESLSEIKSLAVSKTRHKRGIGTHLVRTCLDEAANLEVKHVFVLTNAPQFFRKLGFKRIAKTKLPHKIWTECYKCAQFPNCCEEALIKKVT